MNYDGGSPSILILTTDSQPVSYYIEATGLGINRNGTLTADNETIIHLPSTAVVTSHVEQNKGIYLKTSSDSVIVIGRNLYSGGGSADTFLALPIVKLSVTMYVYFGISAPQSDLVTNNNIYKQNVVIIVGTEDNTIMKLIVTQSVTISVGSTTTDLIPSNEYSFVINRLQTVSFQAQGDLSGTKITTNKQVSVYSGHSCANVPSDIAACDYLIEQLPPTALWGKVHYVTPLSPRKSYTIKIVSAYDSTNIKFYCNNSLISTYTLNEGSYIAIALHLQEHCALISNKEVLVAQFSHGQQDDDINGDPMMMLLPATIHSNYNFKFSTLRSTYRPDYRHYVNIVVTVQHYQPDIMYLITGGVSTSLNTQQWVPIKVNNIIEAYATHINIPEGVAEVVHNNKAALMTTVVYGFGSYEGYGHPGGHYPYKISGKCNLCTCFV